MKAKTLIEALLEHYREAAREADDGFRVTDDDTWEEGLWSGRLALANESTRLLQTLQALEQDAEKARSTVTN